MKEKLEVKVLVLIFSLLIVGIGIAFFFTVYVERKDVKDISKERMLNTSRVILKSIERSMLEADATFTKDMVDELKNISGYELAVYNFEGREAFNSDATPVDDKMLRRALENGEDLVVNENNLVHTYMPLRNLKACRKCHDNNKNIMGAVSMTISLEDEFQRINRFTWIMLFSSIIGLTLIGCVLWYRLRLDIIQPVKSLELAAEKMTDGDLSFDTSIISTDEIGRLNKSIKDALHSISGILQRVKDVSRRVAMATEVVEKQSHKVLEGTLLESEAVSEISSSVEEMNVSIAEIADSTQRLADASQDSAASLEETTMAISSIKDITHEVSEGIDTTTSSIHQFSASIKEVVENANDLSKVSDETLSAVEEITTTVKEVEGSAKESAKLSRKVMDDSSSLGIVSIRKTIDGMESIRSSVSKTAESIARLGGRSEEIGNILTVIDDITDQTTLLSLNAAILAAQAGEHGKGFSVVANEIKDLAERTALSTKEIDSLIKTVRQEVSEAGVSMKEGLKDVDNGMTLAKEASYALNKILDSAKKSAEMSASIERTTTEQANTARYVSEAIEKVRFMVDHIVKATTEQSKGVHQIMQAAERMREAAAQADNATEQQAIGSRQILDSVDSISDMSQQISRALNEQKVGSKQIWVSVEKIKNIPEENREMAYSINKTLRNLAMDVDLINVEMERFALYTEKRGDTIEMAVVPFEPPSDIYRNFSPLVDYLSRKIGRRVLLKVMPDFESAPIAFESGRAGLGFLTSLAFLEAQKKGGARPLAKAVIDGKPYHRAAIITREHTNIKTLEDLKGKNFAFVDKKSTCGFLIPKTMMEKVGLSLDDLSGHQFYSYHNEVVRAVLSGEADAGAVMENVALSHAHDGVSIIGLSEQVPSFVLCAGREVDNELADSIFDSFAGLESAGIQGKRILESLGVRVTGFVGASDSDFKDIKRIASQSGDLK